MVEKPSAPLLMLTILLNTWMSPYLARSAKNTVKGSNLVHRYHLQQSLYSHRIVECFGLASDPFTSSVSTPSWLAQNIPLIVLAVTELTSRLHVYVTQKWETGTFLEPSPASTTCTSGEKFCKESLPKRKALQQPATLPSPWLEVTCSKGLYLLVFPSVEAQKGNAQGKLRFLSKF